MYIAVPFVYSVVKRDTMPTSALKVILPSWVDSKLNLEHCSRSGPPIGSRVTVAKNWQLNQVEGVTAGLGFCTNTSSNERQFATNYGCGMTRSKQNPQKLTTELTLYLCAQSTVLGMVQLTLGSVGFLILCSIGWCKSKINGSGNMRHVRHIQNTHLCGLCLSFFQTLVIAAFFPATIF